MGNDDAVRLRVFLPAWEPKRATAATQRAGTELRAEALRGAYGLTPAEVRVALGSATGRSVPEIAKSAGVQVNTVRVQLKRAMHKTRMNRQ